MHRAFLTPPFLSRIRCCKPHLLSHFKMVQDHIFSVFSPCERIMLGGCSLEFKSNLNSNANQPTLIHSWHEKGGAWAHCAWRVYTRNLVSGRARGAQKKGVAHGICCPFKFKLPLNLNGQLTFFIHSDGTHRWGMGRLLRGRNFTRTRFS